MTQSPRIRRAAALLTDERRYRPGHPHDGVATVSPLEASKQLTQTVRDLIVADELAGYWRLIDKVYQFTVYQPAIADFIARNGRFPEARRRQRPPRAPVIPEPASTQAELMALREAVRRQSSALVKMQEAFEIQEYALGLLNEANLARSRAAGRLRAAIDELNEVAGGLGIPDFAPSDPPRQL